MTSTLHSYFDKIFVLNRDSRTDRWERCAAQLEKFGITAERFSAHDKCVIDGHVGGNGGCTASHRAMLEVIAYMKWPRTLILEDDFEIVHEDFNERFDSTVRQMPAEWDMFYLGGHYAEKPQSRHSTNVIRMAHMMTTSSYGVSWEFAREAAPHIFGNGPIDCLYYTYHERKRCYILDPRLIVQRECFSDLQGRVMNNRPCMEDERHARMV